MSVLMLLLIFTVSSAQKSCSDSYECRNFKMREPAIKCNGYYGCRAAAITTTDGYIDCSAMLSCHDAHGIKTEGNLYCSAYKTCYRTNDDYQFDVEGFIQCGGANSCDHSERKGNMNAGLSIYCGGIESCLEINEMNSKSNIHCLGDKSCARSAVNAGDNIYCNGNSGCAKSELVALSTVSCNGEESCIESTINANTVNLYGSYSGVQSIIYASNVNIYGVQSFHKGIIDSQDEETVDVKLFGETAGNGATIICRAGSTCNIACKATGCNGLQYQCESGANCLVEPSACLSENDGKTINGVHCPEITTPTATKFKSKKTKTHVRFEHESRRRLKKTTDDSVECLNQRECESKEYTDVAVICGGFESCITSVIHAGETGKDISCYGGQSCLLADLETRDGAINCYGAKSCYRGDIRGKHMLCLGQESCGDIKCDTNPCDGAGRITSVDDMKCYGTNSCKGSKIKTMSNLECSANRACYDSRIDARFDTICDGHYACSKSNIIANHELSCNGMGSCLETELDITKLVTVYGYFGAVDSIISANEIRSFGYLSTAFSTVDSQDKSQIDVHFFGHLSGFGSSVICRKGSVCNLVCKTTGCVNVDFVCLEDAECNVLPKQCMMDDREIVDDVVCPNLITDLTVDDDLSVLKEKRMEDFKQDAEWMQALIDMKSNDDEFDLLQEQSDMDLLKLKADDTILNRDDMVRYNASSIVEETKTIYYTVLVVLVAFGLALCWFYNRKLGKDIQYQQIP
eukprot:235233_1